MKTLKDVDITGVRVTSTTLRSVRTKLPQARVAGRPVSTSSSSARYNIDDKVKVVVNRHLTNSQKRDFLRRLKQATGEETLDFHLIVDTRDGAEFQLAPVKDIKEFVGKIEFGKAEVVEDDEGQKSVTVELPDEKQQ